VPNYKFRTRVRRINLVRCHKPISFDLHLDHSRKYLDIKIDAGPIQKDSRKDSTSMKNDSPTPAPSPPNASTPQDLTGLHLWLILWKAYRALEQHALDSITGLGLGLSDFAALEVLLHKGPQPVNTIGKKILLTSGSVTTTIDRLEAKNLVRRASSAQDQRVRLVQLTPAGKKLISCAFAQHRKDMEQAAAALSPTERRQLTRLLKKLGLSAASQTLPRS
jgi:MarR family 2-MHQ and catechol resistance regulon transcriptional repressor